MDNVVNQLVNIVGKLLNKKKLKIPNQILGPSTYVTKHSQLKWFVMEGMGQKRHFHESQ